MIPEHLIYKTPSFHNYKLKLPKLKDKYTESLLNIDTLHKSIGGDVWLCLWFRRYALWGNQISLEYNRFSGEKLKDTPSSANSLGKFFIESYFPIELIPLVMKSLKIFQKIIGKRKNNVIVELWEFKKMIEKEFEQEETNGTKQTKLK